jgi:hypothetical protein
MIVCNLPTDRVPNSLEVGKLFCLRVRGKPVEDWSHSDASVREEAIKQIKNTNMNQKYDEKKYLKLSFNKI